MRRVCRGPPVAGRVRHHEVVVARTQIGAKHESRIGRVSESRLDTIVAGQRAEIDLLDSRKLLPNAPIARDADPIRSARRNLDLVARPVAQDGERAPALKDRATGAVAPLEMLQAGP